MEQSANGMNAKHTTGSPDKGLTYRLYLIEALLIVLPSLALFYAFFVGKGGGFRLDFLLICMAVLLLVLSGLLLLRQIFGRISQVSAILASASPSSRAEVRTEGDAVELQHLVGSFRNLQKDLDAATAALNVRVQDILALEGMCGLADSGLTADERFGVLLGHAVTVTEADAGLILIPKEEGSGYRLVACRGTYVEPMEIETAAGPVASLVASEGGSLVLRDISPSSPAAAFRTIAPNTGVVYGTPLLVYGTQDGVLLLARTDSDGSFHESRLQVLSLLLDSFRQSREKAALQAANESRLVEVTRKDKALLNELTQRKQTEEALRRSEERYRAIMENIEEGYFEVDLTGSIVFYNAATVSLLGYAQHELLGMDFERFTDEENAAATRQTFQEVYRTGIPARGFELEIIKQDGRRRTVEISVSLIRNPEGKPVGFRGIGRDVTERKHAEMAMNRLAYHDPLTGLPNRRLFSDRLTMAIAQAKRRRQRLALMLIDLDRFKDVNDSLGHHMGDMVLQEVGERLTRYLRKSDTAARIGGDEFTLVLPEMSELKDAEAIARKIMEVFQEPLFCSGQQIPVSVSIGIAIYPDDADNADDLTRYADRAMYAAKAKGRNNFQCYHTILAADAES